MQRTANLITALTALALAVAFVAGLSFQAQRTDAAAATIAALNVGTCHTTDAGVLDKDDCNPHRENFEFDQEGLDEAIEVDSLYATYAHDPKTADEPARVILEDSDLIKISITDQDRDVREGVLMMRKESFDLAAAGSGVDPLLATHKLALNTAVRVTTPGDGTVTPTIDPDRAQDHFGAVVADAISGYAYDGPGTGTNLDTVPALETTFSFKLQEGSAQDLVQITEPGIVELLLDGSAFKPIASGEDRGEMRFFGTVTNPGSLDDIAFGDLNAFLEWDEDVVEGAEDRAPAFSLQANPRVGDTITVYAIHYLTSNVEYLMGGETCLPLSGSIDDPATADINEGRLVPTSDTDPTLVNNSDAKYIKDNQAACIDDELGDNFGDYDELILNVSADGVQTSRNLYLEETGRFTGVFEGFVQLTDSDGDGWAVANNERVMAGADGAERINWGLAVRHAPGEVDASGDPAPADRKDGSVLPETGAIIGVDNGPVRITYKDTDGVTRNFMIAVDIEPPAIVLTTPLNNARSDDEEINFAGTINDSESGLAEDSFALYVDHTNDPSDINNLVLDLSVRSNSPTQADKLGVVSASTTDGVIATETQYAGYSDATATRPAYATFGVLEASKAYLDVGDAATDDLKGMDAEDHADGDSDAEFRDSVRINFDLGADDTPYNHAIDFQALVRDVAGNIGFSDSDDASPRYINDLGTKVADRLGTEGKGKFPNVIGVFTRHVVYIDNVDPEIDANRTVTGFYDVNSDSEPLVDRSGVMVVFDGPVDSRSIGPATFQLTLGEDPNKEVLSIVDTTVSGKLVFLKLADALASDATPELTIATGEEVRDLAGRVTRSEEQDAVTVKDGNLPVFTVALSDGTGTGTGAEGPSMLTKDTIKVAITSDEDIQGAPKVAVVCSNLAYKLASEDEDSDIEDYVGGLSGAIPPGTLTGQIGGSSVEMGPDCGILNSEPNDYAIRPATSLSRRDNTWEYTWRQVPATNNTHVPDGMATVVVWGNDRSDYTKYDDDSVLRNYGSTSTQFRFDETFVTPLSDQSGGRVLPAKDSEVAERRPFVLLDFSGEPTTVTVTELLVDGVDVTESLDTRGQNQMLYWPETLSSGEHEVMFSARDAADNKVEDQSFKFEVTARDPFVLSLFAGWNAISFPADPKANTLEDIFGESAVDRVIGWIPSSTTGPWAIATKADGVWMSSIETANLDTMKAQYGYWVHSTDFVDVSVELQGPIDRETGDVPLLTGVPTYAGWNFVGVVDQDGDQTEGRAGSNLKDGIVNVAGEANVGQQDDIEVKDYLAGFARAYRWDVITNSYQVLTGGDNLKIGEGIWVYFDAGIAP